MIASKADDRELAPLTGRVDVVVDSPLAPSPRGLDLGALNPGQVVTRRATLGDTLDAGDVPIEAIETTCPSMISLESRPTDEVVQEGRGYTVHGRYAIDVKVTADERKPLAHERVTIRLGDGRVLDVPVVWSVVVPLVVEPREIIVADARPGRRVERTLFVRLTSQRETEGTPRVVEAPETVETRVEPFGPDQWRIRVRLNVPDRGAPTPGAIVIATAREGTRVAVPLIFQDD
jgi:hypothetical protein